MSNLEDTPEAEEEETEEEPVIEAARQLEAEINGLSVRLRGLVPDGTGITYRCETCYHLSDEHPRGTVKYCKGKAYNHDEYVRSMTVQRNGLVELIDRLVNHGPILCASATSAARAQIACWRARSKGGKEKKEQRERRKKGKEEKKEKKERERKKERKKEDKKKNSKSARETKTKKEDLENVKGKKEKEE